MPKIINTKRAHKQFFYYVPISDDEDDESNKNSQPCEKCSTTVQCNETCDNEHLLDQDRPSCSKAVQCTHKHSKVGSELNSDSGHSMSKHTKGTDHSTSSSVMNVEANGEKPDSENSADSNSKRPKRNYKRKGETEDQCPVCGITVRHGDLPGHFDKEVHNLKLIARNARRYRQPPYTMREGFRCGINLTYFDVKGNRENRIKAHKAKYAGRRDVMCPICRIRLSGTDLENNTHVYNCFREEEFNITVTDSDDDVEEYEIGNETRVRAISLVPGGHRALHGSSTQSRPTDEDADLNVDVEDTQAFGKPQYTELDVIHNIGNPSRNQREVQLRRAVASDSSAEPQVVRSNKWCQNSEIQNEVEEIKSSCSKDESNDNKEEDSKAEEDKKEDHHQNAESDVTSTLKEKINGMDQEKNVKCLICLEPYTRPVVSTTCWHVHCEECWLVSMGVKKLCPQCNMIVCPTDLRRIYL